MKNYYKIILSLTILSLMSVGWGQNEPRNSTEIAAVSLEIQNVNTDDPGCTDPQYTTQSTCEAAGIPATKWYTGTLDIYMFNYPGCSYCEDLTYNNNSQNWTEIKELCEDPSSGASIWIAYDPITEEECSEIPSLDGNGGWWFNGKVGGFQFKLPGVTITGASGGTASEYFAIVNTTPSTIIGFDMSGGTIPPGEGILTQVTFTDFAGEGICFGTDPAYNVIADAIGGSVSTEWGDCYCAIAIDCAGECGGDAQVDECGVCGGDGSSCGEDDCSSGVCLSIENVDTGAGTLDIYMTNDEEVGGFQFELIGVTITGASGGTASEYFAIVNTTSTTILGFDISGATIPPGEGILTQVTYSNFEGESICFGEDTGSAGNNVIASATGGYIAADWDSCYCSGEYDECGVCNGQGAIYECGCNDIEEIYNESTNVVTISSVAAWDNGFHYDFTYTLGEITYQTQWGIERDITGLSVFCHETGETWDFNSDRLRSGNFHHDYSELMERYENFTLPENRDTYAYIWAWDEDGTGNYHAMEFYGFGFEDGGDYFEFYQGFDWFPLSWGNGEETFPNLEFEMGTYDNFIDEWGGFDFNYEDDWTGLENELITVGLSACDCEGNLADMCGVCNGDGIADGECDCEGNVFDECDECGGPGAIYECGCDDFPSSNVISAAPEGYDADGNAVIAVEFSLTGEIITYTWFDYYTGIENEDEALAFDSILLTFLDGSQETVNRPEGWNYDDWRGSEPNHEFQKPEWEESSRDYVPWTIYSTYIATYFELWSEDYLVSVYGGFLTGEWDFSESIYYSDHYFSYDGVFSSLSILGYGMLEIQTGGESCDCDGNTLDCTGECGGTAEVDNCGVCDYDPENNCVQDCNGEWGGTAVEDACGVCDGNGTYVDECDVCDGPGAIYECGCYDTADIPVSNNVLTLTNIGEDSLHYEFTYTLGELTYQDQMFAERIITGLSVYCLETEESWTFDSDSLRSGNENHDYSDIMERYENFTPSEIRDLDYAILGGYDDDYTGNYHYIWFDVYATDDNGNYFYSYQEVDWYPLSWGYNDVSFPNLEFESGSVYDPDDYDDFFSYGYYNYQDNWADLSLELFSVGIDSEVCDCDGNILDCAGECGGMAEQDNCGVCDDDFSNDCVQDCLGVWGGDAVMDACGECDGGIESFDDCADISVSPDSLSADLNSGETATQTLTISNDGGIDLEWEISSFNRGVYIPIPEIDPYGIDNSNTTTFQHDQIDSYYGTFGYTRSEMKVLVVRDVLPWGGDVVPYWIELGTSVTVISSYELSAINLNHYDVLYWGGDDSFMSDFYNNITSKMGDIEEYIENGGSLFSATGSQCYSCYDYYDDSQEQEEEMSFALPGGINGLYSLGEMQAPYDDYCETMNLPDEVWGMWSYHNTFANLEAVDNVEVFSMGDNGLPVGIEYSLGSGHVIFIGNPSECYLDGGYCFASGLIYPEQVDMWINAASCTLEYTGPNWLSTSPTSGTIPARESQAVEVTFDATDLIGGDYSADIVITSNDPDEGEISVPVSLTVTGGASFEPEVTLNLSNLNAGAHTDIGYGISQQFGESYLSSGTLTSGAGHFDYSGLAEGDSVGYGMIDFIDGTDTSLTSLAYQVEVAQLVSDSLINLYTRITASNNDDFEVGTVFGGYVLENLSSGVSVYAESPGDHEITNSYSTNVTLAGLFVNPASGSLSFEAEFYSVAGDVVSESFDFEIYETSECNSPVCLTIQNVDTTSNTLDIYMENSEPVGGFQFEIFEVSMDSAFGGSAAENDFTISVNADMILGFSMTGATIPAGTGLLTSIAFSSYSGSDICFGTNPQNNAIADAGGYELEAQWNCWGDDAPIEYYYLDNGNYALEFEQDSLDFYFENGYQPEWYDDENGNGQWDEGEDFDDINDNGLWDSSVLYDQYIAFNEDHYTVFFNGDSVYATEYYIDLDNSLFCEYDNDYYGQNNHHNLFPTSSQHSNRDWECMDIILDVENSTFIWFDYYMNEILLAHAVQGCLDTEACNYDDEANTQLYDLTLCDYDCGEGPEEFSFNQSSSQAFYFVMSATDMYGDLLEAGDWIGLFNGDVCVGAREWPGEAVDIPTMGDDGFEYSEGYLQEGDIPTFKIYDFSEDRIYSAFPSNNFAFAAAQIFFVDEISGMLGYELSLNAGASLVSFYTLPDDNSIANVIGECLGNMVGVLTEGMAAACIDGQWIGILIEIDLSDGYWILANNPETLTGYGTNYDPGRVYDLHYGANLISYSSLDSANLSSSIPDDVEDLFLGIISEGSAALNTESGWVGSLTTFDGGMGYWVIVSEDLTFSYETGSMARSEIRRYIETRPGGSLFNVAQSPNQAFYFVDTITLDEGVIEDGDWLLSYNGYTLTGIRQWQGVMIDIPAMGLSEIQGTEGYLENGDIPTFKLFKQSTGEYIPLGGDILTWTENGMYALGSLSEMQPIPNEFVLNNAYPNPFNPVTTLEFGIPVDGDVSIEVYNLQGRLVATLVSQNMKAGYHSVTWNADSHASGMYFVQMVSGEYLKTQKLMLVK